MVKARFAPDGVALFVSNGLCRFIQMSKDSGSFDVSDVSVFSSHEKRALRDVFVILAKMLSYTFQSPAFEILITFILTRDDLPCK